MLVDWLGYIFDQTDNFPATILKILEPSAELTELVTAEHVSSAQNFAEVILLNDQFSALVKHIIIN